MTRLEHLEDVTEIMDFPIKMSLFKCAIRHVELF